MKKSNSAQKSNKMPKSKQTVISEVSELVVDTLAQYIPKDKLEASKTALLSRKGDLEKIFSKQTVEKKVKDPNAPKRGKSSYIFFCVEYREKIKKSHPDMDAKDIIKELGQAWRQLPNEKKQKYEQMASKDKERYSSESKDYTPPAHVEKKKQDGPKKGKSSYIFFCQEQREVVKQDYPDMKPKEITAKLGELWNGLSDEDKKPYIKMANSDKDRYESEKGTSEKESTKELKKEPKQDSSNKKKKS